MLTEEQIKWRLRDQSDAFNAAIRKKNYAGAKRIYEDARAVAVLCEMDEKTKEELFGSRQNEEHPVEGLFREELVQKVYEMTAVRRSFL